MHHGLGNAGPGVLSGTTTAQLDDTAPAHAVTYSAPQQFFYEPDVAVIRAGLVQHLAQQIGAQMLDRHIAYLTSADYHATTFARCWQIIEALPFNERILKQTLRRLQAGAITVKKRGSPVDTDALAKRLSQPHGEALVVVLTQVADQHTAIICRVLPPHRGVTIMMKQPAELTSTERRAGMYVMIINSFMMWGDFL
jgi:hypothetical protein